MTTRKPAIQPLTRRQRQRKAKLASELHAAHAALMTAFDTFQSGLKQLACAEKKYNAQLKKAGDFADKIFTQSWYIGQHVGEYGTPLSPSYNNMKDAWAEFHPEPCEALKEIERAVDYALDYGGIVDDPSIEFAALPESVEDEDVPAKHDPEVDRETCEACTAYAKTQVGAK